MEHARPEEYWANARNVRLDKVVEDVGTKMLAPSSPYVGEPAVEGHRQR